MFPQRVEEVQGIKLHERFSIAVDIGESPLVGIFKRGGKYPDDNFQG